MEGDLSQAMERYTAGLGLLVPLLQSEPKGLRYRYMLACDNSTVLFPGTGTYFIVQFILYRTFLLLFLTNI